MVARGLVRQFVEAADEIFEEESHLLVREPVGVQVHVAELRDDEVQDIALLHLLDLALELEELEDVAHVGRKALDIADEVRGNVVRIPLELVEIKV